MSRPPAYQLIRADCGRGIPLANGSIHAVVTSPPYYALRSYAGVVPTEWPELAYAPMPGLPPLVVPAMTCCLGAEPDPAAFVGHLVRIFDDVKRVLHQSGCAWVNLGDSYNSSPSNQNGQTREGFHGGNPTRWAVQGRQRREIPGYKSKDLLMVPARFALAMQACGWYLRSAPPWVKPGNAMPESVDDRPTTAHESLFMFTKSPDYYFDMESVRRGLSEKTHVTYPQPDKAARAGLTRNGTNNSTLRLVNPAGRSLRTADLFLESLDELIAWHLDRIDHLTRARQSGGLVASDDGDPAAVLVNPEAFRGSHYAVMPRRLAEILVRCSTSEAGVCAACGAPWERVVEREPGFRARRDYAQGTRGRRSGAALDSDYRGVGYTRSTHLGWRPTCSCPPGPTVPAKVFDPFVGSGTTLLTANALGRDGIGIDAGDYYLRMAARRLDRPHAVPLVAAPAGPESGPGPLFSGGEP